MQIYHANAGTLRPAGARFMASQEGVRADGHSVCHTLIVDTGDRLILVDTGFGTQDIRRGSRRVPALLKWILRPELTLEETMRFHLQVEGYDTDQVTDIICTHLDFDHAGGLADFPDAMIHVSGEEWEAARNSMHSRFVKKQTEHIRASRLRTYRQGSSQWFGFDAVELRDELDGIVLVSLPGHSPGHCGVAIRRPNGWLLHAGDAYFHRATLSEGAEPPGYLRRFEALVAHDRDAYAATQTRLAALWRDHRDEVQIFCSHDPLELEMFKR